MKGLAVLDRIVKGIDLLARGTIYLALLVCGASLAALAAVVVAIGSYRLFQFLWHTLLSFEWGR